MRYLYYLNSVGLSWTGRIDNKEFSSTTFFIFDFEDISEMKRYSGVRVGYIGNDLSSQVALKLIFVLGLLKI